MVDAFKNSQLPKNLEKTFRIVIGNTYKPEGEKIHELNRKKFQGYPQSTLPAISNWLRNTSTMERQRENKMQERL